MFIAVIMLGIIIASAYLGFYLYRQGLTKWAWGTWLLALPLAAPVLLELFGEERIDTSEFTIGAWLFMVLPLAIGIIGLVTSKRNIDAWRDCPQCATPTPARSIKYFLEEKEIYKASLLTISSLVGFGLLYFCFGYLLNVGFEGLYLFAIGCGVAGFSLIRNGYIDYVEFKTLTPKLRKTQQFICPGCKHEWLEEMA